MAWEPDRQLQYMGLGTRMTVGTSYVCSLVYCMNDVHVILIVHVSCMCIHVTSGVKPHEYI